MNIYLATKSGHSLTNWDSEKSSLTDMDLWDRPQQYITKSGKKIDGMWVFQGGYLPFHFGPKSDHRLLCIKIPQSVSFGDKTLPYRTSSKRRIRIRHPRGQINYSSNLIHLTREYNILQRIIKYINSMPIPHTL